MARATRSGNDATASIIPPTQTIDRLAAYRERGACAAAPRQNSTTRTARVFLQPFRRILSCSVVLRCCASVTRDRVPAREHQVVKTDGSCFRDGGPPV